MVLRTKDELIKLWVADGGQKETLPRWLPRDANGDDKKAKGIDLDKETVIGVFWNATDRDTIKIERISKQGDKIVVEFRRHTDGRGGAAPDARSLHHVVVVPRLKEKIEFKELPRTEKKGDPLVR